MWSKQHVMLNFISRKNKNTNFSLFLFLKKYKMHLFTKLKIMCIIYQIVLTVQNQMKTLKNLQTPNECKWILINDSNESDVALMCKLHNINSELEYTNFSAIDPQHTTNLKIECSDSLLIQSSLNSDSFRTLKQLKDLSIDYCKIGNISDNTFKGLTQLRNLTIRTHNSNWPDIMLEITSNAFYHLKSLEKLDLSDNSIWSIPNQLLCQLHSLKILNFTQNRIRDLNHFQLNHCCCSNLQLLDLSRNKIENLSSGIFSNFKDLKKLYLQKNNLKLLHEKSFNGLISLRILRLSNNQLINLPPDLFSDMKLSIKEMYLQNNNISILAPGLFNDLINLLVLDISSNFISSEWINSETFVGLKKLVVLDLSKNQLTKFEKKTFYHLNDLKVLRLNENRLETLVDNLFINQYNLHTLTISNNHLSQIGTFTLNGLRRLSLLSIDNNQLKTIEQDSLKNCSLLHDLHLNGNKLTKIPNIFHSTPLLKTLDLGENYIEYLLNNSFDNLRYLYGLRLSDNNITTISNGILNKMPALKVLNLSKNKIKFIETGSLNSNKHLQAIRLDGNLLNDFKGILNNLQHLVWLNISDNQFKSFDYSNIPVNLKWLDIHENQIEKLNNDLNNRFSFSLNTLDVSFNKLTEISANALPDSIRVLYLNNNQIKTIQAYTFFKKPNLTRVDLMNNQLTYLDINSFRISTIETNQDQAEFYLANNPLICDCNMNWLKTISNDTNQLRIRPKFVDIDKIQCRLLFERYHQQISLNHIISNQFLCTYKSHCLSSCHCCEFEPCYCKTNCPKNCTCYRDQSWNENIVNCSNLNRNVNSTLNYNFHFNLDNNLPESTNMPLIPMDTTMLLLDGNYFPILQSHQFNQQIHLRILYLNNSNIETISNETFHTLQQLQLLDLHQNQIKILQGFEFRSLISLEFLYLDNNQIEHIQNDTFQTLIELKYLNLTNNRLKNLFIWNLILPKSLQTFPIHSNPWSCDCQFLINFQNWIKQNQQLIENVNNLKCFNNTMNEIIIFNHINCHINSNNEKTLNEIRLDDVLKESTKTIFEQNNVHNYNPLLLNILIIILIITIVTILLFIYRFEIKVLIYDYFDIRLFEQFNKNCDRIQFSNRDKLFHAFISYSSKDEHFVYEHLIKELEETSKRRTYKLCLHHRDLLNTNTTETIMQAIQASHRTIIVLSDNFLKSEWCRFEFKSAHHQALRDRRKRLIIILLDNVAQRNDLDPDIRLYLKTNICLHWGDKWFWSKLRFCLPDVSINHRTTFLRINQPRQQLHNHHNHNTDNGGSIRSNQNITISNPNNSNNSNNNPVLQPIIHHHSPLLMPSSPLQRHFNHYYYHHYHPHSYISPTIESHLHCHTSDNEIINS